MELKELFVIMKEKNASDLHLVANSPPVFRIDGRIVIFHSENLSSQQCENLIFSILTEEQKQTFEKKRELDLGFNVDRIGRIRGNIYQERGNIAGAFRLIPNVFRSFEELGIPSVIYDVLKVPAGLILVTGPTGSGKTTTLSSIINYLNENRNAHIITIEDPIEYIHSHKKSIISQREVGSDTSSFSDALKYVLREDPDIILIGEIRDLDTVISALTIAETGHLVFATLHTPDTVQSINRIIDIFPSQQQKQVVIQLSFVLQAIFGQQLLARLGGGRVLATEVLVAHPGVRNLIRERKIEQIHTVIQTGGKYKMQTMNQSLYKLYKQRLVSYEEAIFHSLDTDDFRRLCQEEIR